MAQTLILVKGVADVAVAAILAFQPSIIYDSFQARAVHSLSGLHLSNASLAPGFNQSIACMNIIVLIWSRLVYFSVAMNLTFSPLGFLTCAIPSKESELGSATLLSPSCNHLLFSLAILWADPGVLRFGGKIDHGGKKKTT
ncbi:hypothetical protein CPB84DRAFT_1786944 [Gymnopilus junonius]|uniref:Uncharacterized protein n=1 Tax=Gymnopilus junonius TaxID=109634 RepID=A0A9P5NHT9_GYMJU|nr:hypothetical protein CPB84DRAFT_1786944 [Gymnopilus junonius]